jgi:hypothetical protein
LRDGLREKILVWFAIVKLPKGIDSPLPSFLQPITLLRDSRFFVFAGKLTDSRTMTNSTATIANAAHQ